jgi:HSP20 family protein
MNELQTTNDRRRSLVPASQVFEDNGQVEVRIEMPGVAKGDLEIRAEGQELTVIGHRQEPALEGTWLLRERSRGDYQKTFSVDGSIDLDKIEAQLADGVLTLTLPMKEAAKPRKIEIRSA